MSDRSYIKNTVTVSGKIISELSYSHSVRNECFYSAYLSVPRMSGRVDILPLVLSEKIICFNKEYTGAFCRVTGQFRSYRRNEIYHNKLILTILADEVTLLQDGDKPEILNEIYLGGIISRPAIYRLTPAGRKVTDLFLTVRRPHGKTFDLIPCIAWDHNARLLSSAQPSTYIDVWGHIQSREYIKNIRDMPPQKRVAYEVSIYRYELVGTAEKPSEDKAESKETSVDNS